VIVKLSPTLISTFTITSDSTFTLNSSYSLSDRTVYSWKSVIEQRLISFFDTTDSLSNKSINQ
ncbi:10817_t:CDS:1, partial [Funneliformis caledonium]